MIKIIQKKFTIPEEIFPVVESQPCEQSMILVVIGSPLSIGRNQYFLRVLSSPTLSVFLHMSSQGPEQAKTGTPAGRFDPYY